jgi:hypothetical protein
MKKTVSPVVAIALIVIVVIIVVVVFTKVSGQKKGRYIAGVGMVDPETGKTITAEGRGEPRGTRGAERAGRRRGGR